MGFLRWGFGRVTEKRGRGQMKAVGAGYESLSRLDAAFLSFETENAPMHVGLTLVFQEGPLRRSDGGVDMARIRRHVEARLARIPRYRQKLRKVPLTGDHLWVDDPRFHLENHVRHISLPRPGDEASLQRLCGEILERPLNRNRPLWEVWVVEGLADEKFAAICKVHHCMVDGVGGLALLQALLSASPVEPSGLVKHWEPRAEPTETELLQIAVERRRNMVTAARDTITAALGDLANSGKALQERATGLLAFTRRGLPLADTMSFNQPIGPDRKVQWLSMDLARIKAIGSTLEGTVNDVTLATLAGGFRQFLSGRGQLDGPKTVRTVVPVNRRSSEDSGGLGNQASCWMVDLPLDCDNPKEVLRRIRAQTLIHKSSQSALGGEVLTQAAEWANAGIMHRLVRVLSNLHPYNLVITNVPGPPTPLYMAGAPMVAAHPHLPLFEGQGIGIAIFRYVDRLQIGLTGDRDQVPDLDSLTTSIQASFRALEIAAGTNQPAAAKAMHATASSS